MDHLINHDGSMKIQRTIEMMHLFKARDMAHYGRSIANRTLTT